MKDKLDILNKVGKADAPLFLYTRITQRIQLLQDAPVSVKFRFAFAAVTGAILLLNILVVVKNWGNAAAQTGSQQNTPYSSTINNIYYE